MQRTRPSSLIQVRHLTPDDWLEFRALRLQALQECPGVYFRSYAEEAVQENVYWLKTLDGDRKCVVGLFDNQDLCGHAAVFPWSADPSGQTGVMAMDYIVPAYRNRGLSRLLYEARIEWAVQQPELKRLVISHRVGNEASHRANQHFGFRFYEREKIGWPDGQEADEFRYGLDLSVLRAKNQQSRASMSDPEKNKATAVAFYDLMFNQCKPREAIERYVGASYRQHNPTVEDGKEGFIAYFEEAARDYPGKKVHIKRVIAEDNYVVLHCLQEWPGDHDWAGIDIFRFDAAGKIIEHWDVLQRVPTQTKNDNTMF
jgi:predicted SnoaL-like aldol condensation-catalyzing enzyme/RimJ/RimL family protein N-acetyltransferase